MEQENLKIEGGGGAPVDVKRRHVILDALRGFALLGICLANYPEFSLYSFLEEFPRQTFSTAAIDTITQWWLFIFVDGKFYTIFSLLFGIGFSIILENNARRGVNGLTIFYRRMFFLLLIGFAHLILIWSGDILMLYAIVGMILPLFLRCKDTTLLIWAFIFLAIPVIIDYICQFCGVKLSAPLHEWQWLLCDRFGITEENFAYWLRDARDYGNMHKFLMMGAVERMQEFVDGQRYFKVLGLFLIGFWLGRNKIFAHLEEFKTVIKKISLWGLVLGLPLSALYAWSSMNAKPFGWGTHSLFYFISVYLTSFGYIGVFCLLYLKRNDWNLWRVLAFPGRMALTNYILQSAIGVFIFYGVGLGMGASVGLIYGEIIALTAFCFEIAFSIIWLRGFRFGPLEWIWRCLTYLRLFPIISRE
ncbi:MAG: DUF418 domain-containing protein [Muribaculaceae bacterium]|nr:DUF418 domain-containing protein [Muribaculaceae bacterium]